MFLWLMLNNRQSIMSLFNYRKNRTENNYTGAHLITTPAYRPARWT